MIKRKEELIEEFRLLAFSKGFTETKNKQCLSFSDSANRRFKMLEKKMIKHKMSGPQDLKWEYVESALAILEYKGEIYKHKIKANIYLVGTIGGTKIFTRFISHPFYQWSSMGHDRFLNK